MKHHPVTGRPAAQAISQAIWRVCLPPDTQGLITSESISYHETQDGWVVDLDPDFTIAVRNPDAISNLVQLIQPAIGETEAEEWEAALRDSIGEAASILDLLPPTILSGLIDSADLRLLPRVLVPSEPE